MMRVTFTQINDNVQRNLASNYAQLAKLQEQLSSGRRLNRPSDDPIDMKNNVNLKAELAQGTQYHRNIEDGLAWMNMTEVALTDMNELMQRLREQAVYAGNDTMTGTDRQYIAAEVEQLLRQVVSLTNSSYKGNFLFGGTNGDKQVYEYTTGTTFSFDNSTPATTLGAVGTTNTMVTYSNREYYQYQRLDPNTVSVVIDPAGAGTRAIEGQDFTVDYANGTITA
ncbi:MAG: flagellar hook-associated protein 3, partial [Candidatus Raymondbacteria bacterium RifOxyC12_full_50_8]